MPARRKSTSTSRKTGLDITVWDWLTDRQACMAARKYVKRVGSIKQAYLQCTNPEWLWWFVDQSQLARFSLHNEGFYDENLWRDYNDYMTNCWSYRQGVEDGLKAHKVPAAERRVAICKALRRYVAGIGGPFESLATVYPDVNWS